MSTIIYPSPIFGPVHSRRLGVSLGINLMPGDGKICTFDCLYCECGFNSDHLPHSPRPTRAAVSTALRATLERMRSAGEQPDVLTFAGNGEPTAHPDFPAIIDDTIALRDELVPGAKVSVLSNATMTHRSEVRSALMRVDNNIQKLDTVDPTYIRRADRPCSPSYDVEAIIRQLALFDGHVVVQTMFMRGIIDGFDFDNTKAVFVQPWIDALLRIKPREVMVYTIDRESPERRLQKAPREVLDSIRDRVIAAGIPCTASY